MNSNLAQALEWKRLSLGAKAWVWCILLCPAGLLLLLKAITAFDPSWVHEFLDWTIFGAILFVAYLLLRWAFGRGGPSRLWRLELFFRNAVATFSSDKGTLWMRWARKATNEKLARIMIEKAAACNNLDGLYELGLILKGEKREDAAGDSFLQAANRGHPGALWEMGEATRWGLLWMARNRQESRRWHEIAARGGYYPSIKILATALEIGDGLDADPDAAKRWQKRLRTVEEQTLPIEGMDQGSDLTMHAFERHQANSFFIALRFIFAFVTALFSHLPEGFSRGLVTALVWGSVFLLVLYILFVQFGSFIGLIFSIAAIPSIIGLLWMHKNSYRPSRSLKKLEKRAKGGDPNAIYELGMMYRTGASSLPKDLPQAAKWLLKGAQGGHPQAMMQIGQLLAWGYGMEKNANEARRWLEKAKILGVAEATLHLERMDKEGQGE